jgi:hypothetical protein
MGLRLILPEHHLSSDSKDVIKLGMGLTATMSALVLALLIASAKGSYDAQRNELTQVATNVVLLDRVLAHYGPETKAARDLLRRYVARAHNQLWPESRFRTAELEPRAALGESFYNKVQELSPRGKGRGIKPAEVQPAGVEIGKGRCSLPGC